ncbi:TerB family tellurite resistance protein [Granulibacter bethesdensis]|uniref:DnaJ-like protein djlA n=1 Tax=Granulibacter bethesdensis (strain ATCC BAA-1260 / CGDNIH1) TaxID=391165 RepID=Q0BV13_GRABC|nr:TerB family tellurite resistance protein [Granulibacter bethesdensis]ABI61339.1 DnaJ-like protein djlA [Granulibacter bethesdensis CGDNIH1]APH51126.1 DnaJ-like protein djlA [Granulibacter bethesdensis]APH63820.1 DnaJ-like protein djlA [Granulibacter bethesdensis]
MSYWGKILGSVAGFAVGGPFGAMMGAALGHAADKGILPGAGQFKEGINGFKLPFGQVLGGLSTQGPARIAALLGQKEQLYALSIIVLSAKLARADGPVKRVEIDTFRQLFRIPPEAVKQVGHLFDQARDSGESFAFYADQLGESFADDQGRLEDTLSALFAIARSDGPINQAENTFLLRVRKGFRLNDIAWERARDPDAARAARPAPDEPDPYTVLGTSRGADDTTLRQRWKTLMRDLHPDSMAARGATPAEIEAASDQAAVVNAAWDRIKRERGL